MSDDPFETHHAWLAAPMPAAATYAEAGWPVFPVHWFDKQSARCSCGRSDCDSPAKHPTTRHGFRNASTDLDQVAAWWFERPNANVGIATGAPGPDVVDVDVKAGAPGLASLEKLRAAGLLRGARAVIRTPSGGLHLYYAGTEQGNATMARHGVDFRGRGGYVLAPPSYVTSVKHGYAGRYTVSDHGPTAGSVDLAAIRRLLEPTSGAPPTMRPGLRPRRGAGHAALVRWVESQPEGNRNSGLHWAACRAVEAGADDVALTDLVTAGVAAGLPATEAARTVRSAVRRIGRSG